MSYPSKDDKMDSVEMMLVLVRPVFWLCLTWWYFTKADVVAYYKQESTRVK